MVIPGGEGGVRVVEGVFDVLEVEAFLGEGGGRVKEEEGGDKEAKETKLESSHVSLLDKVKRQLQYSEYCVHSNRSPHKHDEISTSHIARAPIGVFVVMTIVYAHIMALAWFGPSYVSCAIES